jgi:hypothetical protein
LRTIVKLALIIVLIFTVCLFDPKTTSDPAASPEDKANEDLSRYVYPSLEKIRWKAHFIRPQDTLERLFGRHWIAVARFNRVDRRHVYPGVTIKVPVNMDDILNYTPMPACHEKAKKRPKYILLNITEQWIGAYEYGQLVFSMPAAVGTKSHPTPTGMFQIGMYHRKHISFLYKTADGRRQYPMDYALLFYIDREFSYYWIHSRDLPGRPVSHGCVGLFDEYMQHRTYGVPEKPVLNDAKILYAWTIGEELFAADGGSEMILADRIPLEIVGDLPERLLKTPE